MALAFGTRLGPYEIESPLGAGGMGEVYLARDTRLQRTVAIKVLPARLSLNPDLHARFVHEAKVISSLQHPNLPLLHNVAPHHTPLYLVMSIISRQTHYN